jgi:hypothetical protein
MTRRTAWRTACAVGLLALVVVVPGSADASSSAAFDRSVTASRTNLVNGKSVVVDKRTINVTVDKTTNLTDRQGIVVNWSGAHPTGGTVADVNSATASGEEYPVVLIQCRGVDSTSVPKAQRLSPQSCWTQTPSERLGIDFGSEWPLWRMDQYAARADRGRYVNVVDPRPSACGSKAMAEYWVPFVGANGHTYPGGAGGCAGSPPEMQAIGSTLGLPGNTTYGITDSHGRGTALFNVRSSESNASLGCSDKVPCSLVVIPIMGMSCDEEAAGLPPAERPSPDDLAAAVTTCEKAGVYQAGEPAVPNKFSDGAVQGSMWWAASNWRNRISVPLDFAPSASVCDITGGHASVDIYGSELMAQATTQWSPTFCLDPDKTAVHHVQTGEPQAANLLKVSSIDAALVSDVPAGGYGSPVVNAPVGVSGFAITYSIDGENGQPYTKLRLDPRLLAKLMTESYPDLAVIKSDYPALSSNPLNLAQDPEFQALNPGIPTNIVSDAASTLLLLNSDSDVIHALTSYINADPEARAWLHGAPDPWGMVVNPHYKDISLPRTDWPLLDTFEPLSYYRPGVNDCQALAPVPYLPLVASPLNRFSYVSLAMQYSLAQSTTACYLPSPIPGDTSGAKLVAAGRQAGGRHFMLGVTTLPDAARYHLATASLQTYVAADAPANLSSTTGRTFVAPTTVSLVAAASTFKADDGTMSWTVPYDSLIDQKNADAYPGTMIAYASVPTTGLPTSEAQAYAAWIRYAAGQGQVPGSSLGQLPAGYLPMTQANGLGQQATYAKVAADAVAAQEGKVPALDATSYAGSSDPNGNNGGTNSGGGTTNSGGGTTNSGGGTPNGSGPTPSGGSPSGSPAPVSLGDTVGLNASAVGMILPILLGVAVIAGLMIPATLLRTRWRSK